jgi:pyruvate kinase
MKINPKKISGLIRKLEAILARMKREEQLAKAVLEKAHPDYQKSAVNLVHYHAFRRSDLRTTQRKLGDLGLTRFANAQGHIMDSLSKALFVLHKLLGDTPVGYEKAKVSSQLSKKLLNRNTTRLLGEPSPGRRVRIMVTMPSEAADNYDLVHDIVQNGMNCARINCAHDNPDAWKKIIQNVKKAGKKIGREVKIAMDLAGPKIRTGTVEPGPEVRKFKPVRDKEGKISSPAKIILRPETNDDEPGSSLPLKASWLKQLKIGDRLSLSDTRHKKRELTVVEIDTNGVHTECYKTAYIGSQTRIRCKNRALNDALVGQLPAVERSVNLKVGDTLQITKAPIPGSSALMDEQGQEIKKAHISCQHPEVFDKVKTGALVLFDDGKIEGLVDHVSGAYFDVCITRTPAKGARLKAEKGINFPNTNLGISGLTAKDKKDLEFVSRHADIVNFSFVNSTKDVADLMAELQKWGALDKLGIILKIETRYAFDHLKDLLLAAMKVNCIGVMIARGDLAVEAGWEVIGQIQHEIVDKCGAAHVPVIWATQVLESMAKNGLPSRSEITDVANSLQTECVMLNKGPYMNDVLQLLNIILSDMEHVQEKTETMLPRIKKR